jgi:hypothetical protein
MAVLVVRERSNSKRLLWFRAKIGGFLFRRPRCFVAFCSCIFFPTSLLAHSLILYLKERPTHHIKSAYLFVLLVSQTELTSNPCTPPNDVNYVCRHCSTTPELHFISHPKSARRSYVYDRQLKSFRVYCPPPISRRTQGPLLAACSSTSTRVTTTSCL